MRRRVMDEVPIKSPGNDLVKQHDHAMPSLVYLFALLRFLLVA
jgi:hypothetical protein